MKLNNVVKKIKITNETNYLTNDLKKIILYSLNKFYLQTGRTNPFKSYSVKVVYSRKSFTTGYAWYNSNSMVLRIPKENKVSDTNKTMIAFASLVWHENRHCIGQKHGEFVYHEKWLTEEIISKEKLQLRLKQVKENKKPTKDEKISQKILLLEKRKKGWETKKKRAENALTKIKKQINYYQKAASKITIAKDKIPTISFCECDYRDTTTNSNYYFVKEKNGKVLTCDNCGLYKNVKGDIDLILGNF